MIITRRLYIVTMVILVTLLLLFMGFQAGKEAVATPGVNKHISDITPSGRSAEFSPGFIKLNKKGKPDGLSSGDEWALFLGNETGAYAATVREWSYYTKIPVAITEKLPADTSDALPDILMADPDFVRDRAPQIARLMNKGVDVIFLALPEYSYVKSDQALREILGIHRTIQESVTLRGVHLFKGFLLGGERIFEEKPEELTDEEETRQDLELNIPWYSVRRNTKTYMRGTLSDEDMETAKEKKYKNEDMPAVIWRSHYGKGQAYAVNGSYLKNLRAGVGMLQAIMYERKDYLLYPVINAQVFSVNNFPILTDENQEQVEKIYGRSITKAQTDIMMPMFITLASNYDQKPSCFLSVKYDLSDDAQPKKKILKTCLSMINDMNGELSLSVDHRDEPTTEDTVSDFDFISSEAPDYRITAVMSAADGLSRLPHTLEEADATDVRTVCTSEYSESLPIVGYLNDRLTLQQTTSNLKRHTFTDELELLGVHTLLAYSNSSFSIADTFYTKTKKDEWQNSSRIIVSNLTTYSTPFRAEDSLTVTESDERIRTYLGMKYSFARSGDVITVTSESGTDGALRSFILRVHNEKITSVRGGDFKQIEEGAYLISSKEEKLEITLSSTLSPLIDMEGSSR